MAERHQPLRQDTFVGPTLRCGTHLARGAAARGLRRTESFAGRTDRLAGRAAASQARKASKSASNLPTRCAWCLTISAWCSLDTLFALGDGLNQLAAGKTKADALLPLAADLRDFEMPHPIFTTRERAETAARMYNNRHAALQPRTDLTKLLQSGGSRPTN